MLKVRMKEGFNHWVPDEQEEGKVRRAEANDEITVTKKWYNDNRDRCDLVLDEPEGGNDVVDDVVPNVVDETEGDINELLADLNREPDVDITALQWKKAVVIIDGTFDHATLLRYQVQEESREPKPRPAVLDAIQAQVDSLESESTEEG